MQKIISLFQRNYDGDRQVRDEVVPGAEWVQRGEGQAYRKWDGTCCRVEGLSLFKRYDAKRGKTPPAGFKPAQEPDPVTGHWPGWLRCNFSSVEPYHAPEDQWHWEGFVELTDFFNEVPQDGTYELCGPRINGNPEQLTEHRLIKHDSAPLVVVPRDFHGIREMLSGSDIEGIVWHHPDGRMVKIKAKDFGLPRNPTVV